MNTRDSSFVPLVLEIHDALTMVAPRGWTSVRIHLARHSDGSLHVSEMSTTVSADRTLPKPDLGLDPQGFSRNILHAAIGDLASAARAHGLAWPETVLTFERQGLQRATLSLLDERETVLHTFVLHEQELAHALFTEPLFDLFVQNLPEADRRQRIFLADINGHDDWNFDAATGQLTLFKGVLPWRIYRAQAIGSYAHESGSWLWAWANEFIDPAARRAVTAIRDQALRTPGLALFTRSCLPASERFASILSLVTGAWMDAQGIYPAPYGPGTVYLAIRDN